MSNETLFAKVVNACVVKLQNQTSQLEHSSYNWSFLAVFVFILAGGIGNIFVCLAVALEKKLQTTTNYFTLSFAVADLLVSFFLMPLGAVATILGEIMKYVLSSNGSRKADFVCSVSAKHKRQPCKDRFLQR